MKAVICRMSGKDIKGTKKAEQKREIKHISNLMKLCRSYDCGVLVEYIDENNMYVTIIDEPTWGKA